MRTWNRHRSYLLTLTATVFWIAASPKCSIAADEGKDVRTSGAENRFDQAVFGGRNRQSVEVIQLRLMRTLAKRIDAIDRCCGLSEVQKKKLDLAGRGAIRQLFQSIDELKQDFVSKTLENEQKNVNVPNQGLEIGALRLKLKSGPFNEDSLFAKTLRGVLTQDQADKYDQRSRLASTSGKVVSVANALDLVRIAKIQKNVYQIVWKKDGKQVAFVEFNKEAEIYSRPDDQLIHTFGHGKKTVGFDFNVDANIVAIGENSKTATIINETAGTVIEINTNQPQPSVKFSPDGKTLATGGYGKEAMLWSTATGELVDKFDVGPVDGGLTPVFSPDGTILAVGHRNSTTRLFDVPSGKLLHTLPHSMSQGLSFNPSGTLLAVTYVDGHLALWDVQTGKLKQSVKSAAEELYTVDWSPDGTLLVTGGNDSEVTIWNANNLSVVCELESPEWVISTKFSPDGTKLVFAGGGRMSQDDHYVETWAVP